MKDEYGRKIWQNFLDQEQKAIAYGHLIDGGSEDKKSKDTKLCVIKKNLNLKIIKNI